jgi:hypothetical protein
MIPIILCLPSKLLRVRLLKFYYHDQLIDLPSRIWKPNGMHALIRASSILEPTVGYKSSVMSSIVILEPTCTIVSYKIVLFY